MKVLKETAFELDMYSVVVGNCVGGDGRWHQKVSKTPVHTHKSDELCLDPRISKERAPGNRPSRISRHYSVFTEFMCVQKRDINVYDSNSTFSFLMNYSVVKIEVLM
jgi:hypothetical protein